MGVEDVGGVAGVGPVPGPEPVAQGADSAPPPGQVRPPSAQGASQDVLSLAMAGGMTEAEALAQAQRLAALVRALGPGSPPVDLEALAQALEREGLAGS
jgi:hypothetical protein